MGQGEGREFKQLLMSGKWRICFVWKEGDAYDVEICDYH